MLIHEPKPIANIPVRAVINRGKPIIGINGKPQMAATQTNKVPTIAMNAQTYESSVRIKLFRLGSGILD